MKKVFVMQLPKDPIIIHAAIALFGGLVHSLSNPNDMPNSFLDLCARTVVASFAGITMSLIALHFWGYSYLTLAVAGGGGYLGIVGFRLMIYTIVKKGISIKIKLQK